MQEDRRGYSRRLVKSHRRPRATARSKALDWEASMEEVGARAHRLAQEVMKALLRWLAGQVGGGRRASCPFRGARRLPVVITWK